MGKPYSIDLQETGSCGGRGRAIATGCGAAVQCQRKLCGKAGGSGVADRIGAAGSAGTSAWRR
jgi:hypothetical protein